ncbi:monovalent cation/H+ antiporter subunit D [Aliihoeflea sp. 40Bstr573]|uniref:monovalent cation/H+ antiporter subunit D n=1 Tax=Aliihoeflea sp. 40Bstr573 TaxID=2696467 RepID=UPI00209604B3|nr:monovalent cation/H+ antiporter subunit D [Aliihoeflea sp. 40Bstr573]MCO6387412.1 monovalent cation/H+ antiporter subunit D [Aliihoeflea sp. 40Bstr573]
MNLDLQHIVIAPILIPLIAGAMMLFFDDRERRLKTVISLASTGALLAVAAMMLWRVHNDNDAAALVYLLGNWPAPIAINLVLDRLSAIMLVVTAIVAIPAIVFAIERWARVGPHFFTLFQFLLVGLNGAFLTGDLFNLFVFFEVMLAASYGLVLHGSAPSRVKAGLHYIVINLVASLIFLIGIALVFGATGSLNMAEIALRAQSLEGFTEPALHVGLAMLGLAFLVKAGMWPLGFWLVPTYASAAAPVAAVFSMLSKVGIYSLLRLALLVPAGGEAFGSALIFIGGAVTLIFASIGVLASQSMQRASAYFVLMSSGTLLATFGMSEPAATAGALMYLLSSTLAVSAFFMVVELLERERDAAADVLAVTMEAYGEAASEDEGEEAEVRRLMPGALAILGIGFSLLAMVLIGLPPLSGFLSKFAILHAIMGPASHAGEGDAAMRIALAVLLILSGVTALIALSRMGIRTFWAPVEPMQPRVTITETAPILFLITVLFALVLLAGPVMAVVTAAAADLHDPSRYLGAVLGAEHVPPFAQESK